jgi:cell division protein ZapA
LAETRFRAALESVENAAGAVGENLDQAAKLPERVAELEAERERLMARIAELEDEISVLSGTDRGSGRPAGWRHWRNPRRAGEVGATANPQRRCREGPRGATKKETCMPLVNVMVNGRAYTIACDEGEEDHLKGLATQVDEKAREVLNSVGQVGDARMMLMAALLIADEHHDMTAKLAAGAQAATDSSGEKQTLHLRAEAAESAAADALGKRRKAARGHCR